MLTLNKYKLKNNLRRGILFLIVFISTHLFAAEVSLSQAQSDVQLKNNPDVSSNSCDNEWLVSSCVNEVRVLVHQQHNCFYEIHYKRFVTGDVNLDGYVDGLDQTTREAQNCASGNFSADFNGDGYVDGLDRTIWLIYDGNRMYLLKYFVLPTQPGQPDTTVK